MMLDADSNLFQFTPLREGRRLCSQERMELRYFNSRPCGRGDAHPLRRHLHDADISIHAPAGGATSRIDSGKLTNKFQFTPLREGRQRTPINRRSDSLFQFTPLREGRPAGWGYHGRAARGISIHAPAGGATCSFSTAPVRTLFQFTPLREGRHSWRVEDAITRLFQFTPLREGRHFVGQSLHIHALISIHAPAGGATAKRYKKRK